MDPATRTNGSSAVWTMTYGAAADNEWKGIAKLLDS
jgi:hypothetical protein